MCLQIMNIYLIYLYKMDLASNNLQWLICHKAQPNQTNQIEFESSRISVDASTLILELCTPDRLLYN